MKMGDRNKVRKLTPTRAVDNRNWDEAAITMCEEERLRIFETMSHGVVFRAADGTIISANSAAVEILGLSLDQMQGKISMDPLWQMIKEDGTVVSGTEHPAMIALQTGKKVKSLIRGVYHPHKQSYVWLSINATPLFKPGETKPYQVYATFDDITERKKAEEALQARERLLSTILKTTIDGVCVVDNQKRIVQVNNAFCAMTGYSREELLSMTVNDLEAVETPEETTARMKQIIENGSALFETCHRRKDGTIFPLEVSVTYLPIDGGLVVGFFRDISERKQAEELLRKSAQENALQSELLKKSPVIIAFHDRNQNIVWANQAYEEATGVLLENMVGQKCYFAWNLSEPCQGCPVPKAIATGEDSEAELTPHNQEYWPESQGSWLSKASPVFDEDGNIIGAIEVAIDITKRKQAEAEILRLNEELEERVKERTFQLERSLDITFTLNQLLNISLQNAPILALLEESLELILSIPWLANGNSGAIFLLENNQLVLVAQRGLEERTQKKSNRLPIDQCLCGKAFHNGEIQYVSSLDEHYELFFKGIKPHGYYCVPIMTVQRVYGVLHLYLYEDHNRDKKKEDFLIAVADILVGVLERKHAEEAVLTKKDELDTMLRIATHLNAELELDKVKSIICEEACSALRVQMSAYLKYDRNTKLFHLSASSGLSEEMVQIFEPLRQDNMENIFKKLGKSGIISDLTDMSDLPFDQATLCYGNRFCAYALVERDGLPIGLLLIWQEQAFDFREDTISILSGIANQAASAITNARLFSEANNRLNQVQALRNIDLAITGSLDLRVTLQILLDEVTRMLSTDAAAILRFDPYSGMLKYEHWRGFRSKDIDQISIPLGEGYVGRMALNRKSVHIKDLRESEQELSYIHFLTDEEFVSYYAVPLIVKGSVIGALEVFHRDRITSNGEWLAFLETLAGQAAIAIDNSELFSRLEHSNVDLLRAYDATIEGWAHALDLKDEETQEHSQRVTMLTLRIASKMGIKNGDLAHVRRGALLHDIGKMGIPDNILLKPGKLTDEEWVIMQKHPIYAFEMLSSIDYLRPALDIPYCHHERWDGSGYPRGLKGKQIPLSARIFAVIDVYDALTSNRPYRKAWTKEKALEHIRELRGIHFDPQVVDVFEKEIDELSK